MGIAAVIALLALPAGIFLGYSSIKGDGVTSWYYLWGNYLWCSSVLYVGFVVLVLVRASRTTQISALIWGNASLAAFCIWMVSLIARGYVDLAIAWILLFPVQLAAMTIGPFLQRKLRRAVIGS